MHRLFAIAVAAVFLAATPPVFAGQEDLRLGTLFERLQKTADLREAQSVENAIWSIWITAEDGDVARLMERGVGAMNGQDFDLALAAFNRIIEIQPDFAEAWNKRATLYFLMRRYDESVRDIARTLMLEPRHFGALSGLGLINAAMGRDAAAIQAFEEALIVNPHMRGARERILELREKLKGERL